MSMIISINYGGVTKPFSFEDENLTIYEALDDERVSNEFAFNAADVKAILNGQERSDEYGLRDGDTLYVENNTPMKKA